MCDNVDGQFRATRVYNLGGRVNLQTTTLHPTGPDGVGQRRSASQSEFYSRPVTLHLDHSERWERRRGLTPRKAEVTTTSIASKVFGLNTRWRVQHLSVVCMFTAACTSQRGRISR